MMSCELILDARAELGEGPSWDGENRVLYRVDIEQGTLHVFDPEKSEDKTLQVGKFLSCVVPRKLGGVAVTLEHGFYTYDPGNRKLSKIAEVEKELTNNRFNDGKCDTAGRFWAGTMDVNEKEPTGALYRLETNGVVHSVLSGIGISNGLGWSPEQKTMYFIDTPTRKVSAFDYDPATGEVKGRRTAVDFLAEQQLGDPDGMAVDSDGMIWVAHWGGSMVTRWDPLKGRLLESVSVPAPLVTSCCFGGKDLRDLYITTARQGLEREALSRYPLSGGLFKLRTTAGGTPTFAFGG